MSRTGSPTQFLSVRIVGALAFLLLCGAALLGGAQKPKTSSPGVWRVGTQAPLINVKAYPKDFQRNSDARWRYFGDGDDQPDQPFAAAVYPYPDSDQNFHQRALPSHDDALPITARYREQSPRAPPLV
jgi:hypothetical protein